MRNVFIIIGVACLILAELFRVCWKAGKRQQANAAHAESRGERRDLRPIAAWIRLAGLLFLSAAGLTYVLP